jgi:TetR/AcrR family transcriptional repressor of nem operon
MAAEHDDLPTPVIQKVQTFTDVNVAWLARMLVAAGIVDTEDAAEARARAIVASIAGV